MGPVPKALKRFIWDLSSLIDMADGDEREIVTVGKDLMARLLAEPDWLPDDFAQARPGTPCHFQIYEDPQERFFIFSELWAPGQAGAAIDHGGWGFLGVLAGDEARQRFSPQGASLGIKTWAAGSVEVVSRRTGLTTQSANASLITQSANASALAPLIGIRVFGGDHPYRRTKANRIERPGWDIYTIGEAAE